MARTKELNKINQKRMGNFANSSLEDSDTNTLLYPSFGTKLYSKEEFELLDSIYSDNPLSVDIQQKTEDQSEASSDISFQRDNFWARNREELLALQKSKNNIFSNLAWFSAGVMLTSVVGLIYLQMNSFEAKQKQDIQIVFQKSVQVMTDKTIDKEVADKLIKKDFEKKDIVEIKNPEVAEKKNNFKFDFSDLFKKQEVKSVPVNVAQAEIEKPAPVVAPVEAVKPAPVKVQETAKQPKYHVIGNGDSLWLIANKYYANPSNENISKIMKANNIRSVYSTLRLGQKLTIPL